MMESSDSHTSKDGLIRLTDAKKTYQMGNEQVHALDGVSISFESGSFWAIMGPSGSGKSTMLNILGGRPRGGLRESLCVERLEVGIRPVRVERPLEPTDQIGVKPL